MLMYLFLIWLPLILATSCASVGASVVNSYTMRCTYRRQHLFIGTITTSCHFYTLTWYSSAKPASDSPWREVTCRWNRSTGTFGFVVSSTAVIVRIGVGLDRLQLLWLIGMYSLASQMFPCACDCVCPVSNSITYSHAQLLVVQCWDCQWPWTPGSVAKDGL